MNYIGSKFKLASFLKQVISTTVGNLEDKVFCDIFAGTGIVGRTFKPLVKSVISNDIEHYSYVLNKNYIQNYKKIKYEKLFDALNNLDVKEGFIYKYYSIAGHGQRQYFSDDNAKRIDTIRQKIQELKIDNEITEETYYFLLTSLIESADKVANTASVYGAYLKKLKHSAQKTLKLEPAHFDATGEHHIVYNEDANKLIHKIQGDILYIDPPYNHRQYGANYHMLNTISLYDDFIPNGKTGIREYTRSVFCQKNKAADAFEDLIKYAKFKYIFLSYNNEGLMSKEEVKTIMSKYGEYSLQKEDYKRLTVNKKKKKNYKINKTIEYLHILKKP